MDGRRWPVGSDEAAVRAMAHGLGDLLAAGRLKGIGSLPPEGDAKRVAR